MKSTFSVLFFVKKDKQKINGSYPIFVRITIDGVASRFNSKLDVQPKLWDGKAGKAAGRSAEATRIYSSCDFPSYLSFPHGLLEMKRGYSSCPVIFYIQKVNAQS